MIIAYNVSKHKCFLRKNQAARRLCAAGRLCSPVLYEKLECRADIALLVALGVQQHQLGRVFQDFE